MTYLWRRWDSLSRLFQRNKKKLFLIDFDGTLAPIARTPSDVVVSKKNIACLRGLSRSPNNQVCIVSGRALADLRVFFKGLPGVIFVGNHGLEFSGISERLIPNLRSFKRDQKMLSVIKKKLLNIFLYWPGIFVEDKFYGITVHYRNVPSSHIEVFHAVIQYYREKFRKKEFEWRKGKKVWEIRTRSMWNKGDAARAISQKFKSYLPVVIGDDLTDENMFQVMKKKGVTVRVGHNTSSLADFYLKSTHDVTKFMEALCHSPHHL